MRYRTISCATLVLTTLANAVAFADAPPAYVSGPWHYRAISCVDSTVTQVAPRLYDPGHPEPTVLGFKETGVEVGFATGLGLRPLFAKDTAAVVHYQGDAGNDVMEAEKHGDRVQVCFLGGPAPEVSCDPDTDDRGRQYRIWDYTQKKQYSGYNSEHLCGGA